MSTIFNVAEVLAERRVRFDETGSPLEAVRRLQVLRQRGSGEFVPDLIDGLPQPGDAHPVFEDLTAAEFNMTEEANGLRWIVEVVYRRPDPMGATGADIRVLSVRVSASEERRDLTHAAANSVVQSGSFLSGGPILNAVGDPFDEGLAISSPIVVIEIVRDEKGTNTSYANRMQYHGTVNSQAITIAGFAIQKHCGRMNVSGEPSESASYDRRYTYRVEIRKNVVKVDPNSQAVDIGWEEAILQCGFRYRNDQNELVRATETVTDENGVERVLPVSKPVLLDYDGTLSDVPKYSCVCPYPEANWQPLGLPQ